MPRIYYPIAVVNHRILITTLVIFISLFIFNPQSFANGLQPQADYYRGKGLEEQKKGHYGSALNFYTKAVDANGSESPVLYNDIGVVYEELGKPEQAEQYYLRIIKVDPSYLPAYSNLAYLYLDLGYSGKAEEYFQKRLKLGPDNDPWKERIRQELYRLNPDLKKQAMRAELEAAAKKIQEEAEAKARADFALAVERSDKHYARSEKLLQEKNYSAAMAELDKALVVTPDNPKILKAKQRVEYEERMDEVKKRIGQAEKELETGDVDSAKKEFHRILATIPNESVQ